MQSNILLRAAGFCMFMILCLSHSAVSSSAPPRGGVEQRPAMIAPETARVQRHRVVKPSVSLEEQVSQLRTTVNTLQSQLAALAAAQQSSGGLANRVAAIEDVVRISNSAVELVSPGRLVLRAPTNMTVESGAKLTLSASTTALNSPMLTSSGTLKSPTAIHDSVISASYTPGAGNIW